MKTIKEIIEYVDSVKPNQYTTAQKIEWLSELDWQIYKEVMLTNEAEDVIEFSGYKEGDEEKFLIVEEPFSNLIYCPYIEAKIDYNNAEYSKFNNSMTMFNSTYQEYQKYYRKNHKQRPGNYRIKF